MNAAKLVGSIFFEPDGSLTVVARPNAADADIQRLRWVLGRLIHIETTDERLWRNVGAPRLAAVAGDRR